MQYSQFAVDIVSVFLIAVLCIVVANILGNISRHVLKSMEINEEVKKRFRLNMPIQETATGIIRYVIYLVGLIAVLNQLKINLGIILIIAAVLLAVIVVFAVLNLKDILPNFIAGFYVRKTKKIKRGETIKVKGIEGRVLSVGMLDTSIESGNREIVFIPNSILMREEVRKS